MLRLDMRSFMIFAMKYAIAIRVRTGYIGNAMRIESFDMSFDIIFARERFRAGGYGARKASASSTTKLSRWNYTEYGR